MACHKLAHDLTKHLNLMVHGVDLGLYTVQSTVGRELCFATTTGGMLGLCNRRLSFAATGRRLWLHRRPGFTATGRWRPGPAATSLATGLLNLFDLLLHIFNPPALWL